MSEPRTIGPSSYFDPADLDRLQSLGIEIRNQAPATGNGVYDFVPAGGAVNVDAPQTIGGLVFNNANANNLTFRQEDGSAIKYNSGAMPGANILWSPRFGFNYDPSHLGYQGVDNEVWGRLYRYYRIAEKAGVESKSHKAYRAEQHPTTPQQELLRPLMLEVSALEGVQS